MPLRTCRSLDIGDVTVDIDTRDVEVQILCDDTLGDGTVVVPFLQRLIFDTADGSLTGITNTELDGTTPYAPQGNIVVCGELTGDVELLILCDDTLGDGTVIVQFLRIIRFDENGAILSVTDVELDGVTPYAVLGNIVQCAVQRVDSEFSILCDYDPATDAVVEFLRHIVYDEFGTVIATYDTELDATTVYAPVGDVRECGLPNNQSANRVVISGAGVFNAPTVGLTTFSYVVVSIGNPLNPPTLSTDSGVQDLLLGESGSWDAEDGAYITTNFVLTTFAGDVVIVVWGVAS